MPNTGTYQTALVSVLVWDSAAKYRAEDMEIFLVERKIDQNNNTSTLDIAINTSFNIFSKQTGEKL